jgi:hypothetical protein
MDQSARTHVRAVRLRCNYCLLKPNIAMGNTEPDRLQQPLSALWADLYCKEGQKLAPCVQQQTETSALCAAAREILKLSQF